jgi:hypothetical protein
MHTRCARFPVPGLPARSSVLGIRPSAAIRSRVPGARYPVPGTRYLVPGGMPVSCFEKPAHGVCMMQDKNGSDSTYLVPGSRYLAPVPR